MHTYRAFIAAIVGTLISPILTFPTNDTELAKRLPPEIPICRSRTVMVGDGDPHQVHYHKQVSVRIPLLNLLRGDITKNAHTDQGIQTCDQKNECEISREDGYSVTVGWSMESTDLGYFFISGGFSVEETRSQSRSHVCSGSPGDTVCVWYRADYTAYQVHKQGIPADCNNPEDRGIMRSPNSGDYNNGFYCVVGTCRNEGDYYWEDGEAGPPDNRD